MAVDWTRWCKEFEVAAPDVIVRFADERKHRVRVIERADSYELTAVVVGAAVASDLADLPLKSWVRNRTRRLVGFRIDHRSRLVGEAWVPKAGLTGEEFRLYVRTLASECDRFEYLLTGKDVQ